ncbi:virA/G regulated protein (plasmid) [Rhizobium sp. K1/93]|nr:virA/G regulated protein [Rhizobium sp. L58/93]MBO9172015.1 virA/G regulated protein [Rhizobium sp. L245/93]MBO9187876.1 virA/G regulated protein [Rhizobium sp. E27B/91]QXZ87706.1 virA/G regulated protein [Rhizobium sp. K1/93]QXZ93746.1 virA/G regulated protein [Rhizobium sp. K15/93]QYA05242.1 virA/G regulated protein [Rhizobium sp. B21/90]
MADEEFALDLSRSAPVTSNNEGARTVPIPLTPRSTTVRQDGRDPIITTGFSRSPIPGGSHDLPGTSSAKQWPAFHAQNTAAGIPPRSSEVPADESADIPRSRWSLRAAMQYMREIEQEYAAKGGPEATALPRFRNKRLHQDEQHSPASEPVAKRYDRSKKESGTSVASLTVKDGSPAATGSQGPRSSIRGLDDLDETGGSDPESPHEISTLPLDTTTLVLSPDVVIPGEGQPEETFDTAPYAIEDDRDNEEVANSVPSTPLGPSWPGLEDFHELADGASPFVHSTQSYSASTAAADSSTDAGSPSIASTQILDDVNTDDSDERNELDSQTVSASIHESSVQAVGPRQERLDDFPDLTDEELARIDALSETRTISKRNSAYDIHAVMPDNVLSRVDFAGGAEELRASPAVHREGSRLKLNPPEGKFDDFPDLTDEDLARIDALSETYTTSKQDVAPNIHPVMPNNVLSRVDFAGGADGLRASPAVHREGSGLEFSPPEGKFDDFPDLTDEELARIDALSETHTKRPFSARDVAGDFHGGSLNEAFEKVGSPTIAPETSIERAPGSSQAIRKDLPGLSAVDPSHISEASRVNIAFEKGKQKVALEDEVRPDLSTSQAYQRHPSTHTIFNAEHIGDNLLIGNEPVPPWPHPWEHVVLFETCRQIFERKGKWPIAEDLDNSVILVKKVDGAQRSYMPRNQLLLHLGPQKYLERMKALGLSENTFNRLKTDRQYHYNTPAGPRVSDHDYEFPLQAGVHNPEVMVQHRGGTFFAFWPKLLRLERLATVTNTYGAENVWLKSPDNAYMTPATYNSRVADGAEDLFAKFIHPAHVLDHADNPETSSVKTVRDIMPGANRAQPTDRTGTQSVSRSGHGRDAPLDTREPRMREDYGR